MPCSATYFLEVGASLSLKVATKESSRDKKLWKFRVLGYLSKAKTEEYIRKNWSFFDKCEMLEVSPHVSQKVAIRVSFRDEKTMRT